jgi:hypothetical protein
MLLGLGLIGLGHNLVSRTVKGLSRLIFGPHDIENTVSQRLIHISEDIKHKPVTPIEIFTLLVDTHPELQAEIKQKYGKPYADLPVIQKKQVTESYEEQLRVIGLTEEINNGNIRPSLAGFIISHQLDEKLPDYQDFKALFNMPAARIKDRPQDMVQDYGESAYAKRLLAERAEGSPSKSLH